MNETHKWLGKWIHNEFNLNIITKFSNHEGMQANPYKYKGMNLGCGTNS